jgi:hypothetical protein
MIISCPHCFIDVSPAKDGTCPACRQDTTVIDPAKKDLVPAEFVDGERLPSLCFVCGGPSSGHLECGLRAPPRRPTGVGIWARLLGVFGGAVAVPHGATMPEKKFELSVELPVCSDHASLAPMAPLYVDRKKARLLFPVHKDPHAVWFKNQRHAP